MITYDVNLCIGKNRQDKRLVIKCHDTGVNLRAFLQVCRPGKWQEAFEPYTIPMGSTAVLKIAKPDKKYCIKEGAIGTNGAVLFELPTQAFTAAGIGKAEVSLFGSDGDRITSATFEIEIPEECICECELDSENYIDVMSEQIAKAIDAAERAEKASSKGPIIKDRNWWLFDPNKGEYVDTGISAVPSGEIDPTVIDQLLKEYLKENPVSAGATKEEAKQIAQNKENIEKLETNKLDANKLPEAINDALAQAKASGEFNGRDGEDGKDGADGQPGKDGNDYVLTEADKKEIAGMVESPGGGGNADLTGVLNHIKGEIQSDGSVVYTLETNKKYYTTVNANCIFSLPTVDKGKDNTILVYAYFTDAVSVRWGEDVLFYGNEAPTIEVGYYDIIFTFDVNAMKWTIGVLGKGAVTE